MNVWRAKRGPPRYIVVGGLAHARGAGGPADDSPVRNVEPPASHRVGMEERKRLMTHLLGMSDRQLPSKILRQQQPSGYDFK